MKAKALFSTMATAVLLLCNGAFLGAQVTVGSDKTPESFSVLELVSNQHNGMRLPQIPTTNARNAISTAHGTEPAMMGLTIFNMETQCVETWNGSVWISACATIDQQDLDAIDLGPGTLIGKTCYDIGEGNFGTIYRDLTGHTPNRSDFSLNSVRIQYYTFTSPASGTIKNVRYVVKDPKGVLVGTQGTTLLSGCLEPGNMANSTDIALELDFRDDLNSHSGPVYELTRENAATVTITIIYYNVEMNKDMKAPPLTAKLQDCFCCGASMNNNTQGKEFMCYNLGVTSTTIQSISPDEQAKYNTPDDEYGDLYQWGRNSDEHQLRNSEIVSGPISALDTYGQPTGSNVGKFIINLTGDNINDWRSTRNNDLWNFSTYPSNNPCPTGWRVPNTTELQNIFIGSEYSVSIASGTSYSSSSGNTWLWSNTNSPGWLLTPSGSSTATLFLPAAGWRSSLRSSDMFLNVGLWGYYWSSSANLTGNGAAYSAIFSGTYVCTGYNLGARAYGMSVRCVAE
ncbi:MAG: fibrobacter succinogenes major paralogous domain-containing protein [Paludibacter sp.]|nr:fibrobacter succinogenes major paralogous domain-containing protein [Paludibacter sp.]